MISDWNRSANALDTDALMTYLTLTGNLSAAVEDMESFKLVALATLLSGDEATKHEELARLARKYDTILRRRAEAAPPVAPTAVVERRRGVGGGEGAATTADRSSYVRIRHGMTSVEELAVIFQRLHTF